MPNFARPRFAELLQIIVMTSFLLAFSGAGSPARSVVATLPTGFVDEPMASGLDQPVSMALVPDPASAAPRRILFVEQRTARVRLLVGSTVFTVGVVPNVTAVDNERGLLGVAVDPRWPASPYVYVHYTDSRSGNHVAISRFTLTGDLDYTGNGSLLFAASSRYDLLNNLEDDQPNHNGGTVRFGPDERLYVSLGDDAQGCPAQDPKVLVGKILRLDVSRLPGGAGGPPPLALLIPAGNPYAAQSDSNAMLVWSLGLRNPFRFQIDPLTGALFVADVGENTWEELDRTITGGANMGWPIFEGPDSYSSCAGVSPTGMMAPIADYDHTNGQVVIAAGIYRRPASGALRFPANYEGDTFFLDYYSGFMRRLKFNGSSWAIAPAEPGQPSSTDWGERFDEVSDVLQLPDGTMWYCRQAQNYASVTGEIRRVSYPTTAGVAAVELGQLAFATPVPTPSRNGVLLSWSQPSDGNVRLTVVDAGGRAVRTLQSGDRFIAGQHSQPWDGRTGSGSLVAPGLYFARLEANGEVRLARIILIH